MISAIVLAQNEERHLAECLASLQWADELLLLDSGSQDQTVSIAKAAGARVEYRAFTHFGDQREAALRLAHHPWVFFVDADERVPPALAAEVQHVVTSSPPTFNAHSPCLPSKWWMRPPLWGYDCSRDFLIRLDSAAERSGMPYSRIRL